MKKHILGIIVLVLFLAIIVTTPRVDYVKPDIFFYIQHLSPLYFPCVLLLLIMAVYLRDTSLGILSVVLLTLLIFWTPDIMLVQPWSIDSYPFTAEAVYITRNGHLGVFHCVLESPALGLILGPYLLITGIEPFTLQKIYQGFITVVMAFLIYQIAEKMKLRKKSLVFGPLCFVSIMWTNIFHVCRQSFSMIFYLASWLFLFTLILEREDRRIFMLLIIQIFVMVIAHPATPVFFIANLIAVAVIGRVLGDFRSREIKIIIYTLSISVFLWFWWNTTMATGTARAVDRLTVLSINLIRSLTEDPTTISGTARLFEGYTPLYGLFIKIKLAFTVAVTGIGVLLPLIFLRYYGKLKSSTILLGWISSNALTAIPLIYAGLPWHEKPVLFTLFSFAPLGALFYEFIGKNSKSKMKRMMKYAFIAILVILTTLFMPIIKYAPLPFLYSTTSELYAKRFVDIYYVGSREIVVLEYTYPWASSYMHIGVKEPPYWLMRSKDVYSPNEGLGNLVTKASLVLTYRVVTRDVFWNYTLSMLQIVQNVTQTFPQTTHNKIYDSGWPNWILIPR